MDPNFLKQVETTFKKIDQPLWVVTTQSGDKRSGLTATWIHQASIDRERPTVLLGLAPNHFTCEIFRQSKICVLHLLYQHQSELAYRFARPSSRDHDKFDGLSVHSYSASSAQPSLFPIPKNDSTKKTENTEVPWLPECHTAMACEWLHEFDAGDRVFFLAKVASVLTSSEDPILRESSFFPSCSREQLDTLKADLMADVTLQRPLLDRWLSQSRKN